MGFVVTLGCKTDEIHELPVHEGVKEDFLGAGYNWIELLKRTNNYVENAGMSRNQYVVVN